MAANADGPLQGARPARSRAFFGRRKGKTLRSRQSGLLRSALPALAVDLGSEIRDPAALFATPPRAVRVEIGFGGGEHLAAAAAAAPDIGFIGCEPFVNGVAKMLARIDALQLANVRLHPGDGAELLAALPAGSIDRLFLLYPDPWPKRRQRKRRFVNADTIAAIARALAPGAELRFATDIDDYAAWTLARMTRSAGFHWPAARASDWLQPWPDWPGTRYEAKAIAAARRPVYLTFVRSGRSP